MRDSYLILDEYVSLCLILDICMLTHAHVYYSYNQFNLHVYHVVQGIHVISSHKHIEY